jgi:hypothetical protein
MRRRVVDMANLLTAEISSRDDEWTDPSWSSQRLVNVPAAAVASKRDPRIDVVRGVALLMIFVDRAANARHDVGIARDQRSRSECHVRL